MHWVGAHQDDLDAARAIVDTEFLTSRRCAPHRRLPLTFVPRLHGHVLDGAWSARSNSATEFAVPSAVWGKPN